MLGKSGEEFSRTLCPWHCGADGYDLTRLPFRGSWLQMADYSLSTITGRQAVSGW